MELEEEQQRNVIKVSQSSVRGRKSLPTEIIVEILLKLPVESLLRCKSVSKLWCSLISDPHFVSSHLNLRAHRKLIFTVGRTSILNTCSLYDVRMDHSFINNALEVDYPLKTATTSVRVVGSCNGLLCIHLEDPDILFLWNPSTRKSNRLPSDAYRTDVFPVHHFGFGYDDSTDDYKVVSISLKIDRLEFDTFVKIYSLRNGGWKDIGAFPHNTTRFDLFGKFLNGALHWVACDDDHWTIVSLDLATETFGDVLQPVYDGGEKELLLGSLGEWLCVLCNYCDVRVDLWVMKVYGVKDSWTKLVSVPYMPDRPEDDRFLIPLCISNDGRILLSFGTKFMIYDSKNSSFSDIQNFDKWVEASTFVESLISPMPPAAALEHRAAGSNG